MNIYIYIYARDTSVTWTPLLLKRLGTHTCDAFVSDNPQTWDHFP